MQEDKYCRFKPILPKTYNDAYLYFNNTKKDGCATGVGKRPKKPNNLFVAGCDEAGKVVHEIMHRLGINIFYKLCWIIFKNL